MMSPEDQARQSWQSSGSAAALPPIEELRGKADKFRRKIRRRNLIEYISGAVVLLGFGWILIFGPLPWTPAVIPAEIVRLGAALVMIGTVFALWQLHKRTAPLDPPADGGRNSVLDYQRAELVRQRDAIDSVLYWYILPFVPGLSVLMLVPLALSPTIGELAWFKVVLKACIVPVSLIGVWWLNKFAARKLQKMIDEIDALRAE
ncbi:hypothetical protein [Alteraurantiacibacter aquimixticola]|uniref:Uncharacterized protein n=1 Tax=Alteraurantiacibacter aquimixticola TaxID=2489173 RepID=A0A4T3EZZ0_9SPHN|nr:hypothetical protein [Alteraurantiacibacter aquimixticola]TIX50361.1 hypothetical protein E5222_08775 [Alteraurantiacibacter aquimixticola]